MDCAVCSRGGFSIILQGYEVFTYYYNVFSFFPHAPLCMHYVYWFDFIIMILYYFTSTVGTVQLTESRKNIFLLAKNSFQKKKKKIVRLKYNIITVRAQRCVTGEYSIGRVIIYFGFYPDKDFFFTFYLVEL